MKVRCDGDTALRSLITHRRTAAAFIFINHANHVIPRQNGVDPPMYTNHTRAQGARMWRQGVTLVDITRHVASIGRSQKEQRRVCDESLCELLFATASYTTDCLLFPPPCPRRVCFSPPLAVSFHSSVVSPSIYINVFAVSCAPVLSFGLIFPQVTLHTSLSRSAHSQRRAPTSLFLELLDTLFRFLFGGQKHAPAPRFS